ncbi:hypothetical protein NLU13_9410 [Sarocladium strictum]|uniref:Spindle pole body-associated protein cut12 domain-containing protein n=1 Tax=Sarocladium strictum TaxID=5046 RepID=A0AA39GBH1_SARSR|nr:hypothetical protein NLU13_9410 [Sarocladium strictum]
MLGWMLKRGVSAPGPVADGDTTLADQPDTPAPVFAARAFKSALFGGPAAPANPKLPAPSPNDIKDTPSKPAGILLTPGTGTSRRKRVSFGHDVGQTGSSELAQRIGNGAGRNRKRTRLTTALENASRKSNASQSRQNNNAREPEAESDSEWEEEDEQDPHDITVDLAEPHSESGKYWKQEFHKYREDAKAEMDKMLKYKRLAKSYAKLKDAEAMELAEKLRDEQQKVIAMEKKISESASHIASQQKRPLSEKSMTDTMAKLTKQTALVVQYRQRVQDLEDQLDELVRRKDGEEMSTFVGQQSDKATADLQHELREAREKAHENEELRRQIADLKAELKEARATAGAAPTDSARTRELRSQLREAKEDSRNKDAELRRLRKDHEMSLSAYETQVQEMKDLLTQSQSRYAELKKEIAALKADRSAPASRPRSWHPPAGAQVDEAPEHIGGDTLGLLRLEHPSPTRAAASSRQQTLREKFRKDAATAAEVPQLDSVKPAADYKQTILEPIARQPYVRRSPRNKAYDTGDSVNNVLGDIAPTRTRARAIAAPDLPTVKPSEASMAADMLDEGVDLLKTQFARLGGPDSAGNNSTITGNTTAKGTLPPERRAAALARLERKRVERQRTKTRLGSNKENVRPIGA